MGGTKIFQRGGSAADGHKKNWRPELGPDDAKLSPSMVH